MLANSCKRITIKTLELRQSGASNLQAEKHYIVQNLHPDMTYVVFAHTKILQRVQKNSSEWHPDDDHSTYATWTYTKISN